MVRAPSFDGLAALLTSARKPQHVVHGRVHVDVLALPMPAEHLEQLLPAGVELAPQRLTPSGTHPLLVALARHTGVHLGPRAQAQGELGWDECRLDVPWVRRSLGPRNRPGLLRDRPMNISLRQHVNHVLTAVAGMVWGGDRQVSRVDLGDGHAEVRHLLRDRPSLTADLRSEGPLLPWAEVEVDPALREALQMPWLVRGATGELQRYSHHWDVASASLRPTSGRAVIEEGLLDGLPLGPFVPAGAVELSGQWSIGLPEDLADPGQHTSHLRRAHKLTDIEPLACQWGKDEAEFAGLALFWQRLARDLQVSTDARVFDDSSRIGRLAVTWYNRCREAVDTWRHGWWPGQAWMAALDQLGAQGARPVDAGARSLRVCLAVAVCLDLPLSAVDHVMATHVEDFAADFARLGRAAEGAAGSPGLFDTWLTTARHVIGRLSPLSPEHRTQQVDSLDAEVAKRIDQMASTNRS